MHMKMINQGKAFNKYHIANTQQQHEKYAEFSEHEEAVVLILNR